MDFVEQLKSSVDIVKVIGEYVRLKRVGAGPRYMGLCPFHTEKTPSFSVHQAHQFYKCFGCGAGGDVLKFVMEVERLSFYESLKLLADRNGIPMPKRTEYADEDSKLRAALYQMHEIASRAFRTNLGTPAGADARQYLAKRGVPTALAEEFGIGLSDRSGQDLVRRFEREGFSAEQMEAAGLLLRRQEGGGFFDRFRGRLMFPIHNESGKIIGFGGRALVPHDEPKYLNSPETPIYRKSYVLYNLHRAKETIRKADRTILVEGYMDVVGVFGAGVHEVVASCGTALTSTQVRALKRHSDRIVVNFDPDTAGASAAERSIQMLLEEGMHVRVLHLEGGLDPDEYVKEHGEEAYRAGMEKAPGYFYWLADRARTRFDMRTAEGRVAALQFLLPAIQRMPDKLERAAIASDVAGYLGVEQSLVLEHFRKSAAERSEKPIRADREPVRAVEQLLVNALLANRDIRGEIFPALSRIPQLEKSPASRIFRTLFSLHDSRPEFGFSELEARLDDSDKALLASVVFADELGEGSYTREQALACVRMLEAEAREAQRAELRTRVKEAERAGKLEEALRLAEELSRTEHG
jgi:DNA primase